MIELTKEKGKNVGIFGLARTGISSYEALLPFANLVCFDDTESNRIDFAKKFTDKDLKSIDDQAWTKLDYIIFSPGVPLRFPKPHPLVDIAHHHKIPLISDIELLYRANPNAKYVAITGTNGKSTTTALIAHIMGGQFGVGGNIGASALSLEQKDGYVLEMSSYQLDLLHKMKPNVSVLLNITPDHIDRHGSLNGYIEAKKRIWRNMGKGDSLVIGVDNDITRSIYDELKGKVAFDLVPISAHDMIPDLPYNKSLLGLHNRENIAAGYAVARILGKSHEEILIRVATFGGLAHRMQFVGAIALPPSCLTRRSPKVLGSSPKGLFEGSTISFYNDSKATNAEAASKSLASLENIYWLAGGVPKEGGIESLAPLFDRIKKAYLFGQAKNQFAKTLGGKVDYVICETMEEAFGLAANDARASGSPANVLLAPACASFDQFESFEHRGDKFIELYRSHLIIKQII
jgi:UDP-N-acetylmuramoylalanine--D-glutamate ligase